MAQTRVGTLQVKDGDIQTVDTTAVITSKVADKAVTLAKMADVPTASVFFIENYRCS
jgi:ribosomal protein L17